MSASFLKNRSWASVALLAALATAQVCPEVPILVYGNSDTTCGGSSTVVTLQNNTCTTVDGGFNSIQAGHANDPSYAGNCIIFTLVSSCPSGQLTSGFTDYTGDGDYDACKGTVDSQGDIPHAFYMVCQNDGAVTTCTGGGGPTPSTTVMSSTTSTSTTVMTSTASTSTTKTPGGPPMTTPSPTNTNIPNPYVQSAISSASSLVDQASSAVSSYQADPTNSQLAQMAEDASEEAAASNQEASNIASNYEASSVLSHLNDVASALMDTAVAAIIAEGAPDAAAAAAVADAFGPVAAAVAAALSAAADPQEDPAAPDTTPMSTPTESASPCTLCVECSDAALAEPTPSTFTFDGTATTFSGANKRSEPTATSITQEKPAKATTASVLKVESRDAPVEIQPIKKRATDRNYAFCGQKNIFTAPDYTSYTPGGNNPYSPLYNYYSSSACGVWSWSLQSAGSDATLPIAPANSQYPERDYATEHIFEIQQILRFLDYARQNVPALNGTQAEFCAGFGGKLISTKHFAATGVYDYSTPPLQQVFNALSGGTGSSDSEFVYLADRVNNRKGTYFSGGTPSNNHNDYLESLAAATRTGVVAEYLNIASIAGTYRTVSNRIRNQFVAFGQACNSTSAFPSYQQYGNIDWAGAFADYENSLFDSIEARMRLDVSTNLANARAQIQAKLSPKGSANTLMAKRNLEKLLAQITAETETKLTTASLTLSKLRP